MLNSESEKRSNKRLKALHSRRKKHERANSKPIKQKEPDDWESKHQERYKTLIENIPCAVYSAYPGKAGPTTFMSNKWKDWTGHSPGELYQDPEAWPKCIHPDDREQAVKAYSVACRDNVPYSLEYRIVHKETGQVRYVRDQGHLSKDKGTNIRVDGIITDVTECKRTEKAVRESELQFRNFLDNLGDVAYETDASGNVTYANKMGEKVTGIPLKDIIGKPFLPLFTKESQQKAINAYDRTLNGESIEYELTFPNGKVCHFKNEPLKDENGKIVGVFGIARDTTERKRAESALQESEERFREMFEKLPNVAVQGYGPDGTIRYWNKANESIYGYTTEEALGKDLVELIIPAEMRDYVREAMAHGARTGEMPAAAEFNLIRKDGSSVPVWTSHAVVRHAGKEPELFSIDVDLSELKHAESALQESDERFRSVFNNALVGLYRTTPDGQILMANPAIIRMLGYDSFEELTRRNLEEEGFEPQYFRSDFKRCVEANDRVVGLEADWVRCDGTILSVRESAKAIRDEHGNILYYEGTVEDITARKQAEKKLRKYRDQLEEMVAARTDELERKNEALQTEIAEHKKTEEALRTAELRFRSLIEQTTDAVFCYEYDPPIPTDLPLEQQVRLFYDGVLVECNDVCAKSYGADRAEDVIGNRLRELFGTTPGSLDELFTAMIEGGYRTVDGEGAKKLEDGTKRYYLNNGHGVIEDDKLIRVWGTFRDITERKQAQDALRETTDLLESIFEHTHMLVAYLDPQFNFVRVNRAYAEADEHRQSFFPGRNHFDLYPNEENEVIFRRVVETGIPYFTYAKPFEYAEHPKRGISYWDWSLVPIKNQQGIVSGLVLTLADVTARIRAEEALKASEGKLNAMLQSISDHMSMMDKDFNIIWVNDIAKRRFGDDIVGKKCYEVYHGRQSPCEPDSCLTLRAFQDGGIHEHDTEDTDKDGNTAWYHCVANVALRNEKGEPTAILEISTDITERKQAEEALSTSVERFRSLCESSPMGVFHTDKEGRVLYTNKRWQEISGLSLEESLGFGWSDALHPDDKTILLEEWDRCLSEEKGYSGEFRFVSKSGEVKWVYTKTAPIHSETGQVIGHVGSNEDITERKQAEEALRESEEKFSKAFHSGPNLMAITRSSDGRIIDVNNSFIDVVKYSREELIGHTTLELGIWVKPDERNEFMKVLQESGQTNEFEIQIKTKSGETRLVLLSGERINFNNEPHLIAIASDITDRKRAEQALRESEEKFRSLAEQSPNMIFINIKGKVVYANKKCEEVMGYTREELCSPDFDFLTLIASESLGLINDNFARHLRGEEVKPYDYCLINKKGERIEAINASKLIQYEGQTAILGVVTDITDRKKAEKALRESEQKYSSFVRNFMGIAYRGNIGTWTPLFFHGAVEEITGYREDEFLAGKPRWNEVVHPDDFRWMTVGSNSEKLRSEPNFSFKREYRIIRKDGQIRWVLEMLRNLTDEFDKPSIVEGCIYDITERKNAEQALRESEERLKILFESAPDAIYLIDSEGKILDGNRTAEKLIGFSKDEVIGKSLTETGLLSGEQLSRAEANLKKVATGKISGPNEYVLNRKDGTHVSIEVRTFPVKIEGKMLTLGIARDITKHKRTQQELLEHQAKLKSLASQLSLTEERERHRLATELHDQIGQSLVISKIKLDQLRQSSTSNEFNRSLGDICYCLERIIDNTRSLTFDLSYPILYELGFEAAVAEWLTDQIREKHGIETEFENDGRQKPLDDDIRVLLFRNVRELLINIVKHAQAKKVKVSIRRVNEYINIGVEDDGIGFDPAEVTSMATKRAEFGLFSIRERLEQLGGLIKIDSEPGRGSKITMTAPLKGNSLDNGVLK